jgi:hypothetical protein
MRHDFLGPTVTRALLHESRSFTTITTRVTLSR